MCAATSDGRICGDIRPRAGTMDEFGREIAGGVSDLHVHTTVSDGSDTFEDVLREARSRGIRRVAFTNHDTTYGLDDAAARGPHYGVEVVGGIEVSAWDATHERKVHVLGLGLHEEAPALAALCGPLLERRRAHTLWQLDQVIAAGYQVDIDRMLSFGRASTSLYKQHLMAALIDAPYASDAYRALYRHLFKGDGVCARDITYVDVRDAVVAIVEDGGAAVLAHPGQLDSYHLVPELAALGLRGIEQYHPSHTSADHIRCRSLAEKFDLFCTTGSDYHGTFGEVPHLGYHIPIG